MPADRAALVEALRVCRRWIVEGQAQIGWSVDRIDEVLAAGAFAAPPEATPLVCLHGHNTFVGSCASCVLLHKRTEPAPAPDCRAAVRAALLEVRDREPHTDWIGSFAWGKGYAEGVAAYRAVLDAKLAEQEAPQ